MSAPRSAELNPETCPLRTKSLSGLPAALILTAEFDPCETKARTMQQRLMDAGTPTILTQYDGAIHGFVRLGADVRLAKKALRQVCVWMKDRYTRL